VKLYQYASGDEQTSPLGSSFEMSKRDMCDTEVKIAHVIMVSNERWFKFLGVLFYLVAPFIMLPRYGDSTVIEYPMVFALSGYFFALRWFIGDVLNDISDEYAQKLVHVIKNYQSQFDLRLRAIFNKKDQTRILHIEQTAIVTH
jgi:hypothetical protein